MDSINMIDLFLKAGVVVQFIILWLLLFSILSWTIIIQASRTLRIAERSLIRFKKRYHSHNNFMNLFKEMGEAKRPLKGIERIFYQGFEDYLYRNAIHKEDMSNEFEHVKENMIVNMHQELDKLEHRIPFLGTVSSVSPYIGLFGTVWGIMDAFVALGQVKQATLQMVAPGIAEALIATAMGLFAAIPALLAYNRLNGRIATIEAHYLQLIDRFINDLYRQKFAKTAPQNEHNN